MATRAGSNTVGDLEEAKLLQAEDQFIFLQNTTNKTKRISRKNFFNTPGLIVKGKFISPEGNDVGKTAVDAQIAADLAEASAEAAQTAANGKNRIFYNSGRPDTNGQVGNYTLINGDLWFDISTEANYAMYTWNSSNNSWEVKEIADLSIARVNVGKLTAGFISSQVFELANSSAYIQSSSFVETWTNSKYYKTAKEIPSDVVYVKVESSTGTWRIYQCASPHTSAAAPATFPGAGGLWTDVTDTYPTRTLKIGDRTYTLPDCGFRIVGNGTAELNNVKVRGAVVSQIGFFGDSENAVRIDDEGLTVGNFGRIKSAGIGYSGTDFITTEETSSGGFFLGNTQRVDQEELYQFFIGNPSANFLRWNGTDLIINGKVGLPSGGDPDADAGLEITSGFGIRRTSKDKVLTITGGNGNGITYGAQIDLVGTEFAGASGNAQGQLILSAGYDGSLTSGDPSRDGCIIFRTSRESNANIGVQRLRIDLDGTVRVINAGNANAGAPDDGAGKLVVENEIKVGTDITLTASTGEIEAVSYNSTSSKRFKKKIKNLKCGLDIINSLRPVTFDWKKKEKKNDIGLIAEEVNEILPMIVGKDENNLASSIDYSKLTPILIQAVKELSLEVERLKNKIT